MLKRVLVTGSSRGIGRAIAIKLAADGFHTLVHCRADTTAAEETCLEIENNGGICSWLQFDVSDRENARKIIEHDIEQHGAYFGIVCNAGISRDGPFPGLSDDDWDAVIHTNLDSFYNVLKPCILPMIRAKQKGRIVTLSSVAGITGNRGQVNYSASKAGIIGATKALSLELAKREITVNCIAPGLIETDMTSSLPKDEIIKFIPMRRFGTCAEIAGTASFLFSDIAGYITGQTISVNGGMI